jgi:hypothetical protein
MGETRNHPEFLPISKQQTGRVTAYFDVPITPADSQLHELAGKPLLVQ